MTRVFRMLGVAATTLGLSTQAEAACNIRGEFCGRPAWAANAFSHPRDRVPEEALGHSTNRSAHQHLNYQRKLRRNNRYSL